MAMCRVVFCGVERVCLLWTVQSLVKILFTFALFHLVLQDQICLLLQVSLDFLLLPSRPPNEKKNLFSVLVLEGLVGLHRIVQIQLLQHYWLGYRFGLLWYWMVCLENEQRGHSVIFEIAPKYCIWTLLLTMRPTPNSVLILAVSLHLKHLSCQFSSHFLLIKLCGSYY